MKKFKELEKIKEKYAKGENIIQYLKNVENSLSNSIEDILISYDFQSGSYIKDYTKNPEFKNKYCSSLARVIENLYPADSILEIGVGEATTLCVLLKNLKNPPSIIFGFDISWSRLKFAKELLSDFNFNNVTLFTANLFEIPLYDNSIDIVYTSHSIEPNGGKEEEALKELYRITKKYLVLLEPAYEFASFEAKERMKKHGYITELYSSVLNLGYKIIEHRPFDYSSNPLNPTGLIIIEKLASESNKPNLVCPISKKELLKYNESLFYSKDGYTAYPIIDNIPCLLKENSILVTHLLTDYQEFKQKNNIVFKK